MAFIDLSEIGENYLQPGEYTLEITVTRVKESEKAGEFLQLEMFEANHDIKFRHFLFFFDTQNKRRSKDFIIAAGLSPSFSGTFQELGEELKGGQVVAYVDTEESDDYGIQNRIKYLINQ